MSATGQVRRLREFEDDDPEDILELSDHDRSLLEMKPNQLSSEEKYVTPSPRTSLQLPHNYLANSNLTLSILNTYIYLFVFVFFSSRLDCAALRFPHSTTGSVVARFRTASLRRSLAAASACR